jgi:hypothetical protein
MSKLLKHNKELKQEDMDEIFNYYEDYDKQNPFLLFLFIVLTFGLYIIKWVYMTNKSFEKVDKSAPETQRATTVMILMPLIWGMMSFILKFYFDEKLLLVKIIEYGGWALIIFLSLQYTYDFCSSFGRMTQTSSLFWYLLLYPGYLSLILLAFGFVHSMFLVFLPVIVIPIMQDLINLKADEVQIEKQRQRFNQLAPKNSMN